MLAVNITLVDSLAIFRLSSLRLLARARSEMRITMSVISNKDYLSSWIGLRICKSLGASYVNSLEGDSRE